MKYQGNDKEIKEEIVRLKRKYGKELLILTHHYQRKDIVDLGDFRGDSFGLSQKAAADGSARYIVFCGVHFMAESAAILAQKHQVVQIPDLEAGCWMADMADSYVVEKAWNEVSEIAGDGSVMPIVYMNSDALIKAHCGRNGGAVCTSSNALEAFTWAFKRKEKIFFFPDEHLGRNTGNKLGIPPSEMIVWDPEKKMGGNTRETIRNAKLILWKGHCLIHTRFTVQDMTSMREKYPDALIVVHPECTQEVVALADSVGSTSFIVKYVSGAPKGLTIIVGTEINLVERLSLEHADKTVVPLKRSLCPNMYKIDLVKLLYTLEHIGEHNRVTVPQKISSDARLALDRMLELSS